MTDKRWTDSRNALPLLCGVAGTGWLPYDGRTNSVRWVMGGEPRSGPRRTSLSVGRLLNGVRLKFCIVAELADWTS